LQNNLAFISTNFGFLVDTISKLETSKMPLTGSLEIVDNAIKQLERVSGEIRVLTNSKLKNGLEKNTGFNTVMSVRDILLNTTPNKNYSEIEYTPKEIMCMKYAPVSLSRPLMWRGHSAVTNQCYDRTAETLHLKIFQAICCF